MTKTLTTPIVVPEAVRRKAGLREMSGDNYPLDAVTRILKEQREKPMSPEQLSALDADLKAYGAKQAQRIGVKERDVTRIIHESRARRRTP
jgi:hypothetical protein